MHLAPRWLPKSTLQAAAPSRVEKSNHGERLARQVQSPCGVPPQIRQMPRLSKSPGSQWPMIGSVGRQSGSSKDFAVNVDCLCCRGREHLDSDLHAIMSPLLEPSFHLSLCLSSEKVRPYCDVLSLTRGFVSKPGRDHQCTGDMTTAVVTLLSSCVNVDPREESAHPDWVLPRCCFWTMRILSPSPSRDVAPLPSE